MEIVARRLSGSVLTAVSNHSILEDRRGQPPTPNSGNRFRGISYGKTPIFTPIKAFNGNMVIRAIRMSSSLETGQTANVRKEEEVRRTEHQLGKDVLGEEREKKEQKENYDPPRPQRPTWCYLTSTQLQDYNKRFEESGGYDVGDVPYDAIDIPIKPVCLDSPKLLEMMEKYSNLALDEHNRHNNTKYKFVKVLKATFSTGGTWRYFITFQVNDMAGPDSPTLNSFRARVYDGFKIETIIEFCAPEP